MWLIVINLMIWLKQSMKLFVQLILTKYVQVLSQARCFWLLRIYRLLCLLDLLIQQELTQEYVSEQHSLSMKWKKNGIKKFVKAQLLKKVTKIYLKEIRMLMGWWTTLLWFIKFKRWTVMKRMKKKTMIKLSVKIWILISMLLVMPKNPLTLQISTLILLKKQNLKNR